MLKITILIGLILFSTVFISAFAETQYLVVDPGDTDSLQFYLEEGDTFEYWISVDGGRNDDVILSVKNPYGGVLTDGKVTESFSDSWEIETTGYYIFEFDNAMSLISQKEIEFSYNIIKKPIIEKTFEQTSSDIISSGIPFGIIIFVIVIIVIIIVVIKIVKNSKKAYEEGKQESAYICGYCDYRAKSEAELYNHSLSCEKYQKENSQKQDSNKETPLDILKTRLAKGEITKDEYDKLKKEFE